MIILFGIYFYNIYYLIHNTCIDFAMNFVFISDKRQGAHACDTGLTRDLPIALALDMVRGSNQARLYRSLGAESCHDSEKVALMNKYILSSFIPPGARSQRF
jgi:hypothetical protein